MQVVIVSRTDA